MHNCLFGVSKWDRYSCYFIELYWYYTGMMISRVHEMIPISFQPTLIIIQYMYPHNLFTPFHHITLKAQQCAEANTDEAHEAHSNGQMTCSTCWSAACCRASWATGGRAWWCTLDTTLDYCWDLNCGVTTLGSCDELGDGFASRAIMISISKQYQEKNIMRYLRVDNTCHAVCAMG